MRKGFKLSLVASALMVAGGSAFAASGAPVQFNKWTASPDGAITHDCESGAISGVTCSVIVEDATNGFKQLMITKGADTFVGTFVTDPASISGTTLGFRDESYIRMVVTTGASSGNNGNGIAAQQTLSETLDGTVFSSTTNIETMTLSGVPQSTDAPIRIFQGLKATGVEGDISDDFVSNFAYEAQKDLTTSAQTRTGFRMELDQVAGLGANGGSVGDVQSFTLREMSGSLQQSSGNITMEGAVNPSTSQLNESLAYAAGDDIKMVWVAQNVDLSTSGVGDQLGSQFGYLSYENKDAATNPVMAKFSLDGYSGKPNQTTGDPMYWTNNNSFTGEFSMPIDMITDPNNPNNTIPVMSKAPTLNDPDGAAENN